tara:strand:- start:12616 stop:13623 length:1008 start_codon:yes stop_codon:yes gene_type:complete
MILVTYGTRPEYIKVKPLMREMSKQSIPFKTLFTGQHKDIAPDDADYVWQMDETENENRLNAILNSCLSMPSTFFMGITHVLVQGDTTSVLGIALTCMNRQIKVIHLEAGLRTYDKLNPYPEEYNRQLVSRIADIHLCPTTLNKLQLNNENIVDGVHVVGNTVLDNLLEYKESCIYSDFVLVTLHRRENHKNMEYWFKEINQLARENPHLEFILPLHPNPNVQKHKKLLKNVKVVKPLSHHDLIQVLTKSKLVITDSGGLQEECSFFNKRCLVCRETTERPEALKHSSVLIPHYSKLKMKFYNYITDYEIEDGNCPFGNGNSSQKICEIFQKYGT